MRRARLASAVDWIAVIVRSLFLVGIAVYLIFNLGLAWPTGVAVLVAVMVVGNGLAFAVVGQKPKSIFFRIFSLIADILFALLLLYLSQPLAVDLSAVGLLPLVSASLYFRQAGAVLMAFVQTGFQGWLALNLGQPRSALIAAAIVLLVYLPVGLTIAFIFDWLSRPPTEPRTVPSQPKGSERERQRVIYNLITTLSASLKYERVLETALDMSASTLIQLDAPADKLKSAVLLFNQDESPNPELGVAVARRFLPVDMRQRIPGAAGLVGRAITTGEPRLGRGISEDFELKKFITLNDCQSAYCIPLRTGLETFGVLLFAHPGVDFFDSERREVLDLIGKQSMVAIQNARLYRDLEQEKERMMDIQEEARKKIARDLHDGPTQSIAAIAMRLNFARRLMERDLKSAAEELFKIEEMARKATKEIRHMLFTLRPLVLESQGLEAALESMAAKMGETFNQSVSIEVDPRTIEMLEIGKQAVIFYIAEEAVNNARKHAQAEHIWVRLKLLKNGLSLLEIEDNGKGFNLNAVETTYNDRSSLGLVNMRERAELVNGILHIESTPGAGTLIHVVIPLTEEASERLQRVV